MENMKSKVKTGDLKFLIFVCRKHKKYFGKKIWMPIRGDYLCGESLCAAPAVSRGFVFVERRR